MKEQTVFTVTEKTDRLPPKGNGTKSERGTEKEKKQEAGERGGESLSLSLSLTRSLALSHVQPNTHTHAHMHSHTQASERGSSSSIVRTEEHFSDWLRTARVSVTELLRGERTHTHTHTQVIMGSHPDYDFEDHYNHSSNHSYNEDEDYDEFYHTVCDKQEVRTFAGIFLPVVYTLALVVGLAGNSMVVFVYLSRKRLRTLTDVFILNLAFADLLLLMTLPFWAADAVNGWEIGVPACKITSALYATNFSCSMLLLACISVDRYRALTQGSTSPPAGNPRRKRVIVCLLVWMAACIFGLPDMVLATVKHHSSGRKACRAVYPSSLARPAKATLELLEVSLSFVLPFLVMMFCYCKVGRALSQAATSGMRGGRRWKAFRVLIAVVGVFLLTQLPYNVVKLVRAMDVIYAVVTDCEVSKGLDRANQVTESLALTHCCLNPMLYIFIGSSFKEHVLKIAKRCGQTGRRYRQGTEQPAVEISLKPRTQSNTQSEESDDMDTSTFTI